MAPVMPKCGDKAIEGGEEGMKKCTRCGMEALMEEAAELCNGCVADGYRVCKNCGRVWDAEGLTVPCPECNAGCDKCGEVCCKEEMMWIASDEWWLCEPCFNKGKYKLCDECEGYALKGYSHQHSRETVWICVDCATKDNYIVCEDCGDAVHDEEACPSGGEYFCPACMANSITCNNCGQEDSRSRLASGEHRCISEEDTDDRPSFHSSSYKPRAIFHGTAVLQVGMELETDKYDELPEPEDFSALCDKETMYAKEDSSLNCGVELVFHPRDERSWIKFQEELRKICKYVHGAGGRSFNTTTCGVHLHLSREGISETTLAKIIVAFIRFQEDMEKISQRKGNSYCAYTELVEYTKEGEREYLYEPNLEDVLYDKIKGSGCLGRYVAVNLSNDDTIEIRTFKGTLKVERLLTYIQFAVGLVDFLDHITLYTVVNSNRSEFWREFKEFNREKRPEMVEYVGNRIAYKEVGVDVPNIVQTEGL